MKPAMTLATASLAAVLLGCASPEPRYYSLASAPVAAPAAPVTQPIWIEVAPVRVPERLNRAQLVVADSTTGGVKMLDQSRWSSSLPDEFRDALSQQLQTKLGAVDTYQQGLAEVSPLYRVTTEVVRLDAEPGERAMATITWTVRRQPDGKVLSGRTEADLPAPGQIGGVVAAYRQVVAATATDIAARVQTLRAQTDTATAR